MLSCIFDHVFYGILNHLVPDVSHRFPYYFLVVPLVFLCSLVLSYVIDLLYRGLANLFHGIGNGRRHGSRKECPKLREREGSYF